MAKKKSYAPTPERVDQLAKYKTSDLAEAVDVAFVEFMTAVHECAAAVPLNPKVTLGWILTQMADANFHWATDLGKRGFINFRGSNPYLDKTFSEVVKNMRKS
jgi:hypothetical protein